MAAGAGGAAKPCRDKGKDRNRFRSRVYAIQVVGGREERARSAIEREMAGAADDVFVPSCVINKKVRGSWREARSLLFPGYVFVQTAVPRELLQRLKRVPGMTRMLGVEDGEFQSLTDDEVAWLDAFSDAGEHLVGMSEAVQEGDRVLVTDGPLKGHETQIVRVDRHKRLAWIEVRMLGRQTVTRVGLEVVRKRG